jgi:hypothetical protein
MSYLKCVIFLVLGIREDLSTRIYEKLDGFESGLILANHDCDNIKIFLEILHYKFRTYLKYN